MHIPVIRNDSRGHGYFGAPRGARTHNGVDFVCDPSEDVAAFVSGEVTKLGYPYKNDLSFRYVQITDSEGYDWRYFYCEPIHQVGEKVLKDDIIGFAQDVAAKYDYQDLDPMTNHYHLEIMKNGEYFDPLPFVARA